MNSLTKLFDDLEYKSNFTTVTLPYSGSPKYNLHNLSFIIEKYCYFILKSINNKEVYKISSKNAKGSFKNNESYFNGSYGHLCQDGINYRIATTVNLDKKIIQIPESEQRFFKPNNNFLFFKNNLFIIIDSSKCLKYVDYYYNDAGNLTIDLARMIEQGDCDIFGYIDGSKIITSIGDFNKCQDVPPESFIKTATKGCTAFSTPKYYAIKKNRSIFEGTSYASVDSMVKDLGFDYSSSWMLRVSKKNADIYETLNNRKFLSQDIKNFNFIKDYLIIKSENESFLKEAYDHFKEVQNDLVALDKIDYMNNNKVCKISEALSLFVCKSREEKAFYKKQLSELRNQLGDSFTINYIKECSQLGGIKPFKYSPNEEYHYYNWVKNGSNT